MRTGVQPAALDAALAGVVAEAIAGRHGLLYYLCPACGIRVDIADLDANGDSSHGTDHTLHIDVDTIVVEVAR